MPKLDERLHLVEGEAAAHQRLRHEGALVAHGEPEEVVDLDEAREVARVLGERRPAAAHPAAAYAHDVEVRGALVDPALAEVAEQLDERRAVLRHGHEPNALDEAAQAADRERLRVQLGEHGEPLLRARGHRAARVEEAQVRLRRAVLRGKDVGLDLM